MRIGPCLPGVMLAATLAACGGPDKSGSSSPPPQQGPTSLNGSERLEWDQQVAGDVDLSRYRFAAYVDTERVELPAATCQPAAPGMAICRSPFPTMSPGSHELTFVSYIVPDNVDSASSTPPLKVIAGAGMTVSAAKTNDALPEPESHTTSPDCSIARLPNDSAVAAFPTGELRFEDSGRSRSLALEWTMPEGAWTLRAVAAHPEFWSNRWLYVVLSDRADESRLALVRYRELNGVLGERAMLATFPRRTDRSRARLRFGPDGKLYLALLADPTALARESGHSSGEPRLFMMRLEEDGTVPADNPGGRAFLDVRGANPTAFDWDRVTQELWIVEQLDRERSVARVAGGHLSRIPLSPPPGSAVIGLGVVHTPNAPAVERLWTLFSDGLAAALESPIDASGELREFGPGRPHEIHDALLTPEGDVLSCGTTTPDGPHFVHRSTWR